MNRTELAPEDTNEEQLDKAIDEMRGTLKEEGEPARGAHADLVMGIPVEVQIVLGSTEMPVSELMALQKGSTVSLDRRVGEPVDIVVNGRRIARGEITLLEHDQSRFGVRLTKIGGASDK